MSPNPLSFQCYCQGQNPDCPWPLQQCVSKLPPHPRSEQTQQSSSQGFPMPYGGMPSPWQYQMPTPYYPGNPEPANYQFPPYFAQPAPGLHGMQPNLHQTSATNCPGNPKLVDHQSLPSFGQSRQLQSLPPPSGSFEMQPNLFSNSATKRLGNLESAGHQSPPSFEQQSQNVPPQPGFHGMQPNLHQTSATNCPGNPKLVDHQSPPSFGQSRQLQSVPPPSGSFEMQPNLFPNSATKHLGNLESAGYQSPSSFEQERKSPTVPSPSGSFGMQPNTFPNAATYRLGNPESAGHQSPPSFEQHRQNVPPPPGFQALQPKLQQSSGFQGTQPTQQPTHGSNQPANPESAGHHSPPPPSGFSGMQPNPFPNAAINRLGNPESQLHPQLPPPGFQGMQPTQQPTHAINDPANPEQAGSQSQPSFNLHRHPENVPPPPGFQAMQPTQLHNHPANSESAGHRNLPDFSQSSHPPVHQAPPMPTQFEQFMIWQISGISQSLQLLEKEMNKNFKYLNNEVRATNRKLYDIYQLNKGSLKDTTEIFQNDQCSSNLPKFDPASTTTVRCSDDEKYWEEEIRKAKERDIAARQPGCSSSGQPTSISPVADYLGPRSSNWEHASGSLTSKLPTAVSDFNKKIKKNTTSFITQQKRLSNSSQDGSAGAGTSSTAQINAPAEAPSNSMHTSQQQNLVQSPNPEILAIEAPNAEQTPRTSVTGNILQTPPASGSGTAVQTENVVVVQNMEAVIAEAHESSGASSGPAEAAPVIVSVSANQPENAEEPVPAAHDSAKSKRARKNAQQKQKKKDEKATKRAEEEVKEKNERKLSCQIEKKVKDYIREETEIRSNKTVPCMQKINIFSFRILNFAIASPEKMNPKANEKFLETRQAQLKQTKGKEVEALIYWHLLKFKDDLTIQQDITFLLCHKKENEKYETNYFKLVLGQPLEPTEGDEKAEEDLEKLKEAYQGSIAAVNLIGEQPHKEYGRLMALHAEFKTALDARLLFLESKTEDFTREELQNLPKLAQHLLTKNEKWRTEFESTGGNRDYFRGRATIYVNGEHVELGLPFLYLVEKNSEVLDYEDFVIGKITPKDDEKKKRKWDKQYLTMILGIHRPAYLDLL